MNREEYLWLVDYIETDNVGHLDIQPEVEVAQAHYRNLLRRMDWTKVPQNLQESFLELGKSLREIRAINERLKEFSIEKRREVRRFCPGGRDGKGR